MNNIYKSIIAIVIIGLVILAWAGLAGYLNYPFWPFNDKEGVFCTQDVKLCPDGSYVSRTGPKCEFAACPGVGGGNAWKTITDPKTGVIFEYPERLSTEYINVVDWPPQVQVLNEPFTCAEGGSETARAGKTEKRMVDDRTYCVTKITEGAAGSIYTMYAYAFPQNNPPAPGASAGQSKTIIFTFSTRLSQCGNYNDPQKTACENEQTSFDMDAVVDRMARSVK